MKKTLDLGFVIPVENEAKELTKRLKNKNVIEFGRRKIILGKLGELNVGMIISGCGKIKVSSATQLLIDKYSAKMFIHFGTAGAISPKLKIGDVVAATEIVEHDVKELFPEKIPPPVHKLNKKILEKLKKQGDKIIFGTIISGDEDIVDSKRKNELFAEHRGLSVDWESAGFALTCDLNNVPSLVFRVISDLAYESTKNEYESNQKAVVKIITDLIIKICRVLAAQRACPPLEGTPALP